MQGSAGTRADINIRNNQNETPLHVSLKNYVVLSCIDSLLQRGKSSMSLFLEDFRTYLYKIIFFILIC